MGIWIAGLGWLTQWHDGTAAAIVAIAISLIAGILVGPWWVLLIVAIPALWMTGSLLFTTPNPSGEDWTGLILFLLIILAGAPLTIGVALRRVGEGLSRRHHARPRSAREG